MLLAEAPGADEDVDAFPPLGIGRPLVGKAGRLLDKLLTRGFLEREELVLTNRVRCRPPGNRLDEHPYAILACEPWTQQEIEAYNPGVVVLMGKTALRYKFGGDPKVGLIAGTCRDTDGRVYIATYHPAAVFRQRAVADIIVRDLKEAKRLRDEQ